MNWLARASRVAVRLVQPLVPRESGGVTIFTYHLIGAGTHSPVDVATDVFRAQLEELSRFAHVCSLPEALMHLESGRHSARPLVVLTFDDGFDNFRTSAWPLLKELNVPCTLYVPVGFIERTSASPLKGAEGLRPLDWAALRHLAADPLFTLGSHSWHHHDMRMLDVNAARWELRRSREHLEDRTGAPVEHFCYPQAKWSHAIENEVRATYRTAVIAGGRRNLAGRFNPLRLGRVPVRSDMPVGLTPAIESAVWLEEWAASYARALT